uniref:BED-type domain-containing protein n=1 Tax=Phaseolus vulgaris TaxID=3885 RepID=V7BQC0_PHAVU|nr:hypothetical protein PHAVU_006G105700g [Phaseolus vulgaris]ESW19213.1 hypothetical protein PHAVU_006G105700g [Phaseolus vulgaris]
MASGRTDPAWKHCVSVDGTTRKLKCKYCEKVLTGGVYRLKHHLAGTSKDVGACVSVPEDVKKSMLDTVHNLQQSLLRKSISIEESNIGHTEESSRKRSSGEETGDSSNIFKRKGTQSTINSIFKKNEREDGCQEMARFFYNNAIPFNVANSEEFKRMVELIGRHGPGLKSPSYHEIRVKYLKQEVENTKHIVEEHKLVWKKTGCTIMTDGWTDRKRRTILNFLVNSPRGTVFLKSIDASDICKTADKIFKMIDDIVEEVGEENVIQVVTDNAANYKAAGELLMQKRKKLYWTPCAAHCIDMMLEDFEKKIPLHHDTIVNGKKITTYIYSRTGLISLLHKYSDGKDLIRPANTRFATSYLTLGCLNDNKGSLIKMFTSSEWQSSQFAKTRDGGLVENLILDKGFWKNILNCLRGALPLIKVLRMVDSHEKPAMGFIYEEMDIAKEKIQNLFNGVSKSYTPIWEIIDHRWDNQLHRPLHAAGYYLNPMLHYHPDFKVDYEVKRGLYECLERLVGDLDVMGKVDLQLESFKTKSGLYELQRFAIRVLSLTCSSSGCERNWSAFERVHTKKRNRLHQRTMNDVVFVMTNSRLTKKKDVRKTKEYTIDDLSSDDEWTVEENETLYGLDEDILLEVGEDDASRRATNDLEVPPIDDDLEVPPIDDNEKEDLLEDQDDYPMISVNDLIG